MPASAPSAVSSCRRIAWWGEKRGTRQYLRFISGLDVARGVQAYVVGHVSLGTKEYDKKGQRSRINTF